MHIKTLLATTAFSLSAALTNAHAIPVQFNFEAIAQGDVNGPITGSFSIDLAQVGYQYQETLADGTLTRVLSEWPAEGWGLINWTLPNAGRSGGSSWGATITRSLLTNGGSELTLTTAASYGHGASGSQSFTLTFASDTDAMYTLENPFASLGPIKSAIGSYHYDYDLIPLESTHVSYQFALTGAEPAGWTTAATLAVPEPATWALTMFGVMGVVGWRSRASRASRSA